MNLTDLTAELETRATDAVPSIGTTRLTGVRHRIRARRRRQAASAAGLTALCVAAIVLTPSISGLRADQVPNPSSPDRSTPTTPLLPAPTSGPLHFAAAVADDPLIASGVGRPGQRELVIRFTPTDANIAVANFCRLTSAPPPALAEVEAEATINDHPLTHLSCDDVGSASDNDLVTLDVDDPTTDAIESDVAELSRARWAALGVSPGKESVLRIRVISVNGSTEVPKRLRLGLGVYNRSGRQVVSHGVALNVQIADGSHRYSMESHRIVPSTSKKRSLKITTGDHLNPGMVLIGNVDDKTPPVPGRLARLFVDGKERGSVEGSGTLQYALKDTVSHRLEVRLDPGLHGTMVLAYYVDIG